MYMYVRISTKVHTYNLCMIAVHNLFKFNPPVPSTWKKLYKNMKSDVFAYFGLLWKTKVSKRIKRISKDDF